MKKRTLVKRARERRIKCLYQWNCMYANIRPHTFNGIHSYVWLCVCHAMPRYAHSMSMLWGHLVRVSVNVRYIRRKATIEFSLSRSLPRSTSLGGLLVFLLLFYTQQQQQYHERIHIAIENFGMVMCLWVERWTCDGSAMHTDHIHTLSHR